MSSIMRFKRSAAATAGLGLAENSGGLRLTHRKRLQLCLGEVAPEPEGCNKTSNDNLISKMSSFIKSSAATAAEKSGGLRLSHRLRNLTGLPFRLGDASSEGNNINYTVTDIPEDSEVDSEDSDNDSMNPTDVDKLKAVKKYIDHIKTSAEKPTFLKIVGVEQEEVRDTYKEIVFSRCFNLNSNCTYSHNSDKVSRVYFELLEVIRSSKKYMWPTSQIQHMAIDSETLNGKYAVEDFLRGVFSALDSLSDKDMDLIMEKDRERLETLDTQPVVSAETSEAEVADNCHSTGTTVSQS